MAQEQYLQIDQGSTFEKTLYAKNPEDDSYYDLDGYTLSGQYRKHYSSNTAYSISVSAVNASVGQIKLVVSANTSISSPSGEYLYDILAQGPTKTIRILEGSVSIRPRITK